MKERPILFSGPMVRALLDGRKTQTRRILKVQPLDVLTPKNRSARALGQVTREWDGKRSWFCLESRDPNRGRPFTCRYGEVGDRLWVRETFSYVRGQKAPQHASEMPIHFWADGNPEDGDWTTPKASIHMPRWASRATLTITDVWIQRVQDISEKDALAEGFASREDFFTTFYDLNKRAPRTENPWVWALTFEVAA